MAFQDSHWSIIGMLINMVNHNILYLINDVKAALSWAPLTAPELVMVFIELYHLFGKRLEDYIPKPDQEK